MTAHAAEFFTLNEVNRIKIIQDVVDRRLITHLRGRIHSGAVPGQDGIKSGEERVDQLHVSGQGLQTGGAEAHLVLGDGRDHDTMTAEHRLLLALQHHFRLPTHDEGAYVCLRRSYALGRNQIPGYEPAAYSNIVPRKSAVKFKKRPAVKPVKQYNLRIICLVGCQPFRQESPDIGYSGANR